MIKRRGFSPVILQAVKQGKPFQTVSIFDHQLSPG
jgi:hypothetical protein